MLRCISASLLVSCVVLSGCSAANAPARMASAPREPICETASGNATTFGQSTARLYATASMRNQASDIRGELLQGGWRRIRVSRPVTACQPLPPAFQSAGLAHCRSVAQVCGQ